MGLEIISARMSAIAHSTEDPKKVAYALYQVCSEEEFHPLVEKHSVKGHFGNAITRWDFVLQRRSADSFFRNFWSRISLIDRQTVLSEVESRLDEEGRLHMRIDKQESFREILRLRDEDPIKVEFSFRDESGSAEKVQQFLQSVQSFELGRWFLWARR